MRRLFYALSFLLFAVQPLQGQDRIATTGCIAGVPTTVLRDTTITNPLTLAEIDAHEAVHRLQLSRPGKTCEEWLAHINQSPDTLMVYEAAAYAAQAEFAAAHGTNQETIDAFWMRVARGFYFIFEGKVSFLKIMRALGGGALAATIEQQMRATWF